MSQYVKRKKPNKEPNSQRSNEDTKREKLRDTKKYQAKPNFVIDESEFKKDFQVYALFVIPNSF